MEITMVVLLALVAIEAYAIYLQVRHIKQTGRELREYGTVITGNHKPAFSRGCSVALAVNKKRIVKKAKATKGMGTFSRFHDFDEIEGMSLEKVRTEFINENINAKGLKKSRAIALDNALNSYYE